MRIDLYTKVVLTMIAVILAVIASGPLLNPHAVEAQGPLGSVQFFGASEAGIFAVDTRTGDIWSYANIMGQMNMRHFGTFAGFGKPMIPPK